MQDQRAFATVEQEVFSAPHYLVDSRAAKCFTQIGWHWPAQIWIPYRDAGHAMAFKMGRDSAADDFDFRQFRQLRLPKIWFSL